MVSKNGETPQCSNTNGASNLSVTSKELTMKSIANASVESHIVMPATFHFQEAHDVRIQVIDGDPWFCLKDVCEVLTIANSRRVAAEVLDSMGVRKTDTLTDGGKQQLTFVNEPNLYRVIFRSNKPEARQFQDWVFNDVLPTIRKTGTYQKPESVSEPLNAADMANLKWVITMMTNKFKYQDSWTAGIWHALRRATGTPSPKPFTVDDLPVIAQECRRIMNITSATSELLIQFEKDVLKQVVRNRKDFDTIANKMHHDFQQLDVSVDGRRALEKFEEFGLMKLENRLN
jgi:prophage antirepressor-like protein